MFCFVFCKQAVETTGTVVLLACLDEVMLDLAGWCCVSFKSTRKPVGSRV